MATSQDFVNWVCGPELLPRYLHYILISEQESVRRFAHGSVHPTVYYPEAKAFHVCIPSLSEQEAIVGVLGALDDKIEVDGSLIACVDSLLQVSAQDILNVSTRTVKLRDVVDLKYGKALKATERSTGTIPVYGSNGISGSHDRALIDGPGIIVGRKGANAGSVSWSDEAFWPIDTAFYVVPRVDGLPMEFLFFLLLNIDLRSMVGDSAIPGLNREIALSSEVSVPGDDIIRRFADNARNLFALRSQKRREIQCLAELRDTLLPKLMSGEIRVRDAEKAVEEAT